MRPSSATITAVQRGINQITGKGHTVDGKPRLGRLMRPLLPDRVLRRFVGKKSLNRQDVEDAKKDTRARHFFSPSLAHLVPWRFRLLGPFWFAQGAQAAHLRPMAGDEEHDEQGADAAADDGDDRTKELRRHAGFETS
jgi:hypothetical protein